MSNTLTARFDSRDMADLALMRLRRNGVEFSVSRLTLAGPQPNAFESGNTAALYGPYSASAVNPLGSSDAPYKNFGSRALLWQTTPPEVSDAILQLSIKPEQASRAREILRSAHGRDIRLT